MITVYVTASFLFTIDAITWTYLRVSVGGGVDLTPKSFPRLHGEDFTPHQHSEEPPS